MFAIYNQGSVVFRSTADNLYEIKQTQKTHKSNLKPEDDTLIQDYSNKKSPSFEVDDTPLNAYKKIAHLDTKDRVYHVRDIMTQDSISIDISDSVLDAYMILKENHVSQIPVVSKTEKIMGMINKKMILNLIIDDLEYANEILKKNLNDIYLPELITTDPISDIRRVAKVMIDFKLDAIPVVNSNDILVGIMSKTDIIKAVSTIPELQLWA